MFTFAHGFMDGTETLALHAATYNASTYLVGDETVSGTPTFVHTSTIYAKCSDGYYHSFGANKRVIKNGRYADEDNVYADNGSGTLLDPLPMMIYQPAVTNQLIYATDFNDWTDVNGSGSVIAQDGLDLTGITNSAYSIEDTSETAIAGRELYTYGFTTVTTAIAIIDVEKRSPESFSELYFYGDLATQAIRIHFNQSTGAVYAQTTTGSGAYEVIDAGSFWRVLLTVGNTTEQNRVYVRIRPAYVATMGGSASITEVGKIKIGYVGIFYDVSVDIVKRLGPIYTSGSTSATDAIINTYPSANWSNSEGPVYLIFDYKGIDENILLNDGVAILYVTSDVLYLNDGTNTASIACSTEGEHEIGIVLDTTGNKMKLNLDGTYATEATYDNSFGTGNITIEANIREYKRKDESSYTAQQTILDGWMP